MMFKEAVYSYMRENGKTCNDVASELGISRNSFFNKMRGTYSLTFSEAYKLSKLLSCTMEELYAMTKA